MTSSASSAVSTHDAGTVTLVTTLGLADATVVVTAVEAVAGVVLAGCRW